jgi:hypothetical protein
LVEIKEQVWMMKLKRVSGFVGWICGHSNLQQEAVELWFCSGVWIVGDF